MKNKTRLSFLFFMIIFSVNCWAENNNDNKDRKTFSDSLMDLGTSDSRYGGDDFMKYDRKQIRNQIKTFIPPLLRPAFTQHAFVLPPATTTIAVSQRFASIKGKDFFKDGQPNERVFASFEVNRQLTDLDIFQGFDLNTKYLHGFTFRLNIPYLATQTNGHIHPNGQQFIALENAGSTQSVGDIGLFLKKKILDQGNSPFGLSIAGAVFLPTGKNNETFGSNGRITAARPPVPNTTVGQGFDKLMEENVNNGTWGAPQCFFSNFNAANRALCNNNASFGVDAAGPLSFVDGVESNPDAQVGDFPFNNGVFARFSGDGRLPANLQPGTGELTFMVAAFVTRQFNPGNLIGRAALHAGFNHKFIKESDGISPGDITTVFTSFVKPIYKDFLSLDLTFVGFLEEKDSYAGKIPEPGIHTCVAADIGVIGGCTAVGDQAFQFELQDRPSFLKGFSGFIAPSLIFSPDPQIRATISGLYRVIDPDLGPAPETILRAAVEYTY